MPYALRELWVAVRRAPLLSFLSVLAIGFSLFVIGLFGLTAWNIQRAIERVEERVEIVAYLRDDVTDAQLRLAREELEALPEVRMVRHVTKTEALATAMAEMEEFRDVAADLESNPLPASLEVRLEREHRDPVSVRRVAAIVGAYPFMEDVAFGNEWLDKIFLLRQVLAGVATVIGAAFALVAAIVIATAIRIGVYARREEISIMRLVGATDGFIRRPFLLEGLVAGVLGGALAAGLTYGAYVLLDRRIVELEWLPVEWIVLVLAAGTAFGFLASTFAVRRHLRAV